MSLLAATGPSPLWYLARGSGIVALVLVTLSLLLGIVTTNRWGTKRWPRFVTSGLHRNVTLLVLVFLVIHVTTIVLDHFAPIGFKDAFIPFASGYRPIWVGLGTIALDLLLMLVVTSLLRVQIGLRLWRALHWTAYAVWPLAIVHGLATGSDTKVGWMLVVTVVCTAVVVAAILWRIVVDFGGRPLVRVAAAALTLAAPFALLVWLQGGPLKKGWASRAGTPSTLLGKVKR